MAEVGIWSEEKRPEGAHRYLSRDVDEKLFATTHKGKTLKCIV